MLWPQLFFKSYFPSVALEVLWWLLYLGIPARIFVLPGSHLSSPYYLSFVWLLMRGQAFVYLCVFLRTIFVCCVRDFFLSHSLNIICSKSLPSHVLSEAPALIQALPLFPQSNNRSLTVCKAAPWGAGTASLRLYYDTRPWPVWFSVSEP